MLSHSDSDQLIEGWFWRPGNESNRAYGRIVHDGVSNPQLHLVDSDLMPGDGVSPPAVPIGTLHGRILGGGPLTVQGFYPTSWSSPPLSSEDNIIDGFAERVLVGAVVAADAEFECSTAVCDLFGLRELLTGGTVDQGAVAHPSEDEEHAPRLSVDLGDGVSLLFTVFQRRGGTRADVRTTLHASAQFSADPAVPLSVLEREYIQPLQDLILFATRRQSYVASMSVHHVQDLMPVKVLQATWPTPHEIRDVYALALNLGDHADPASVIASWYQLRRRVGPVWETFFSALDRPETLLEDQLLTMISFAEGYHRAIHGAGAPLSEEQHTEALRAIKEAIKERRVRAVYKAALEHANSATQATRLHELTAVALVCIGERWDLDADQFCARLSHTRNWLIHWGRKGKETVEDPAGRAILVRQLIVVMYLNLVRDMGFDALEAARVVFGGWRVEGLP